MIRAMVLLTLLALCLASLPAGAAAAGPQFTQGAAGVGDPYFPDDGNGGYDVQRYDLDLTYDPRTDVLTGIATIAAKATQNLSRFNLDFDGMTVRAITVNGQAARWSRVGGELRVTPRSGLLTGSSFTAVVSYDGVPAFFDEPALGQSGFFHTDDGALVAGQPHGASGWFPANDHPVDKAAFGFRIKVPAGLEAIANGRLVSSATGNGWTTWIWDAPEPMTTYLAMMQIGEFDVDAYQRAGIRYWDAIDPDLTASQVFSPRTGSGFAVSQPDDAAYKRLATTIAVPAGGATLSFWVDRETEDFWDYLAVEAHHPGLDDWTTLPDLNGHTGTEGGGLCFSETHPFLAHYMTVVPPADQNGDWTCQPTGTTGSWNAASGSSGGYESWSVDLSAYAGGDVEVSLSYITDWSVQYPGLFVDDVVVSSGQGSTGFESKKLSPWTVPGPPADSPGNRTDWIQSGAYTVPNAVGAGIRSSMSRQPDFLRFMSGPFGPYPFATSGGVVDDFPDLGFALETQTRPVYSRWFFWDASGNDFVFVHELAHQWYGDSLALARWRDIWLNEGFASYAEWLWSEDQGYGTAQENFDFWAYEVPPDDPFWQLAIGDPGPDRLFDFAVYQRGAMTLHALRLEVGDPVFFDVLRTWATEHAGGNVTTEQFISLAEQKSGRDLDAFFQTWLYTAAYPLPVAAGAQRLAASAGHGLASLDLAAAPAASRSQFERYGKPSIVGHR